MENPIDKHKGTDYLEHEIAMAIDAAGLGYWILDPLTSKLSCNKRTLELFGLPANEPMQLGAAVKNIHQDDQPRVKEAIARALNYENDGRYEMEYRVVNPVDRVTYQVKAIGQAYKNEAGEVFRFSGTVQDVTATKLAQQDLMYRKALLESQNNAIPDALLIVDTRGKIISFNQRFAELWNMPAHILDAEDDEAALQHALSLMKDPTSFINRVQYIYQHQTTASFEEIEFKDGRVLERHGNVVQGEDGTTYGWAWYFRDITERKRWNDRLQQSKDRFEAAIKAVNGILWTANARGEMEGEQPGWAALTGQRYEEYQHYGWARALHPDDAGNTVTAWKEAVKKKQTFIYEHRLKLNNGSWGHFTVRAIPIVNEDGAIREWVGVHTDVTSERLAQKALVESEELFRSFSNNIKNLAWIADASGWIYWYNQRWYDYTGTTLEEMQGWGWQKVHHPDHIERVLQVVKELWSKPEAWELLFPLRSKSGEYRWFITRAEPILDRNGNITKWIGTNTDIHEQVETAEALKRSELSVKLLMEKKDEFMSIASHELKTPMTSLRAAIQLIHRITETDNNPVMLRSLAGKANTQVEKLVSLIEELLDVTRINSGKLQLNLTHFSLHTLLTDCIEQVRLHGFKHEVILEGDCNCQVFADRHRIEQVVNNLISNAIKYSPEAQEIKINCEANDTMLKMAVIDYGIGIPEEKLHFVFDRFFRLHDRSQKFAGIGLGLYISSEIIKRHGGNIGVVSSEGKGSTFWFTIPLKHKSRVI